VAEESQENTKSKEKPKIKENPKRKEKLEEDKLLIFYSKQIIN
jgi:hypothetical protein